jgi:Arc/MetJ family transcription regulator
MRTNIVLDEELVERAFALTGLRTKKDLVDLALKELVRSRQRKNMTDLAGRIRFRSNFDHKALREMKRGHR